jgi:hypothetical protein
VPTDRERRRAVEGRHPAAQRLLSLFTSAQHDVNLRVLTALAAGRLGETRWRRARARQIAQILDDTRRAAAPLTGRLVREVYRLGAQTATDAAKGRGDPGRPTLSRVEAEAVTSLTEGLTGRLDDALATAGRGVDDVFRREGLKAAQRQIAAELPEAAATTVLRERLQAGGVVAFTDRSGRRWDLERYARMVVRTTSSEALSQGVASRMLAGGLDIVDVIYPAAEHYHREGGKEACAPYHGRTFSLTGRTPGYPVLDRLPPWHPMCRHMIKPSRANFEEPPPP